MPKLLEAPRVDRNEVAHYLDRGHWGYILDYRAEHHGEDPDPDSLDELAEVSESEKLGFWPRLLKGLVDLFT